MIKVVIVTTLQNNNKINKANKQNKRKKTTDLMQQETFTRCSVANFSYLFNNSRNSFKAAWADRQFVVQPASFNLNKSIEWLNAFIKAIWSFPTPFDMNEMRK